jgi:crotonobetainyl-CoA:carnitine CoA-transferase CaiB-like acyl-CoA transferase
MPLSAFRVDEIGSLAAGAYCGKLLADFGAAAIKIEPPGGDPGRNEPPLVAIGAGRRESGYFGYLNANKKSAVVDPAAPADLAALGALLRDADVLIDSLSPAERKALAIDHAALRGDNPGLVLLDISWFGDDGPYRDFRGTDSVCRALAGLVKLVGPEPGPPLLLPEYQAGIVGGMAGFIAGMAALQFNAIDGGRGFELSVLDANVALAEYQMAQAYSAGADHRRRGVNRFQPTYPLGIYPCRQGWIGVTVVTPPQWRAFCQMLGLDDLIGEPRYLINMERLKDADALEARFVPRFRDKTAEEWFALARERRVPFTIVPDMAEVLQLAPHRLRGAFAAIRHGERSYEAPGSPLRLAKTPPRRDGRVPRLGEHALAFDARPPQPTRRGASAAARTEPATLPLEGVRIVDLSMGWAGPTVTRHMTDLGAEVIKVEACQYPDWWRGFDPRPIVTEQVLYEKSGWFNVLNRNKRGVTLDLTVPEGVCLLKALAKDAEAVVENYSAGVLPKLGLDYESLRPVNPGLVMLSMPAFGASGPWRDCRAYGSTLEQASGLPSVSGPPDGPPMMNHIAYGDVIGGLNGASALLVALLHRRRTGEGQHIDLSQVECMLPLLAPWLIEQSANGSVSPRLGNRHPFFVPHGVFRCRGEDAWIVVAVSDDAMWQALCQALGRADLGNDPGLATAVGRRAREDEIEYAVTAWTSARPPVDAMTVLQRAGVAAGVASTPYELLQDAHLSERGFWQTIDRALVGRHPQPSAPYRENRRPYPIRAAAPTLGEHNEAVLGGILGLDRSALARLGESGVIGTEAVPPALRKARAVRG